MVNGLHGLVTWGAFKNRKYGYSGRITSEDNNGSNSSYPDLDVSLVVPTASENRVFTVNVVYYIKAK